MGSPAYSDNRPFEHCVSTIAGEVRVDGRRKKIRLSSDKKWVHIGCTTIEVLALDRLFHLVRSEIQSKEIVLQEE